MLIRFRRKKSSDIKDFLTIFALYFLGLDSCYDQWDYQEGKISEEDQNEKANEDRGKSYFVRFYSLADRAAFWAGVLDHFLPKMIIKYKLEEIFTPLFS